MLRCTNRSRGFAVGREAQIAEARDDSCLTLFIKHRPTAETGGEEGHFAIPCDNRLGHWRIHRKRSRKDWRTRQNRGSLLLDGVPVDARRERAIEATLMLADPGRYASWWQRNEAPAR
jgi:hypothetical protein